MYYPFLRGRQFELITLRELLEENALAQIQPIIEPVNKNLKALTTCLESFIEHEKYVHLIFNPGVGDLSSETTSVNNLFDELGRSEFIIPSIIHNDFESSQRIINELNLEAVLLLCEANSLESDDILRPLIESRTIQKVLISYPGRNRSFTTLSKRTKPTIRLDDQFHAEKRNNDFLPKQESRFTEEHRYYGDDRFMGFSDFTVLPSDYVEGGSAPRAVVLHWTYEKEEDIWIRHFTSESNDSIANVQGKFQEAATKVIDYCNDHQLDNSAIRELNNYLEVGHYPGLGIAKKLAIKNHLLVVKHYLENHRNDNI